MTPFGLIVVSKLDKIEKLIQLAKEIGWCVAIPMSEEGGTIHGVVVGDETFVYETLKQQRPEPAEASNVEETDEPHLH